MNKFNHNNGRYFTVTDADIYVEETGSPNGFPLIFLHGGLGTISDFSGLIEKIAGNFRCIGIESRGHGKSTTGTNVLSYELLENDLQIILEQLNISKCAMIGFSDGGIVAYRLAIKKPNLISKLITIGADWNPPSLNLQKLYSNLTEESWQKKFPEALALYEQLNPKANFNLLIKEVISMWLDNTATGYPGSRLKEIQCDTLIIRGDDDRLMPRSAIACLHEYLPNAKLANIPFAGHGAHIDQCEIVGNLINLFLKKQSIFRES